MPDNLYQRKKGGTWYARIEVRGRDIRKSLRTSNKALAKKRLTKVIEDLDHAKFYGEERHTWKAAVGKWTIEYLPGNVSAGTAERYLCSIRQVAPYLEHLYVDEITRRTMGELVKGRKLDEITNATIRRDLTAVSSVISFCVSEEWREDNPAHEWDRRVIKERRNPITLPDPADIDKIFNRAPGNFAYMIRHAQYSGMREEECAGLERPQWKVARKAIDLTRTKTNRPRSVPLDERATANLEAVPTHIKGPWMFWHDEGERYANVASRFSELCRSLKKADASFNPFPFHNLRHWFAVDKLRSGTSIYALQKILGHQSIKTTEIYLDYLTPEEAEAAKAGAAA